MFPPYSLSSDVELFLSPAKRALIGYLLNYQRRWGLVSYLSRKYKVSRRTIYLIGQKYLSFSENTSLDAAQTKLKQESKRSAIDLILSLRLEGKCSLESIHAVLVSQNSGYNSVGFISQTLEHLGLLQGSSDGVFEGGSKYVFCCDELYTNGCPILITVEPCSLKILSIELSEKCDSSSWEQHWNKLLSDGYTPLYICKDEGSGMQAAHKELFTDLPYQSDTFHAVAHRLGLERLRLENAMEKAIETECGCYDLWWKSASDKVFDRRCSEYETAQKATLKAIELQENFCFLYYCMLDCFQLFDAKGNLKKTANIVQDFDVALEFMQTLKIQDIEKDLKTIHNLKHSLFHFSTIANQNFQQMQKQFDNEILQIAAAAWQFNKNSRKIKNNTKYKKDLLAKEQHLLSTIEFFEPDTFQQMKSQIYAQLDNIIQASAAVECINSILRTYLYTSKGNVSQAFLNLFRQYHNNRLFYQGMRKGKSPNQIFYNKEQQIPWKEVITSKV
jgi:hypothetical protein